MNLEAKAASTIFLEVQNFIASNNSQDSVVCFDFFDTLASRVVIPEDTKKIASCQLADLLNRELEGQTLYQIRASLEKRLCKQNKEQGDDAEFSLLQLAEQLHRVLSEIIGSDKIGEEENFVSNMVNIELICRSVYNVTSEQFHPVCIAT